MLSKGLEFHSCIRIMRTSFSLCLLIVFSSCFRPPEFPNEPEIALERLRLTDDAKLLLTFKVRDGDGDIGLNNEAEYNEGQFPQDFQAPYHQNYWVLDGNDQVVTFSGENSQPPYKRVPVARYLEPVCLIKTNVSSPPSCRYIDSGVFGYLDYLPFYGEAGDEEFFTETDPRPSEFDCEFYEIVPIYGIVSDTFNIEGEQGQQITQSIERLGADTVMVLRNPFYYNLHIEIEIKEGNDYIPIREFYDVIEECDPIYTSRFPVFDDSDFGRPLDGSVEYQISSETFTNGPILQETIRFRFFIYDRALNKSNEVITPDFNILDLRSGDLEG